VAAEPRRPPRSATTGPGHRTHPAAAPAGVTTAILLATAAADEGGPAAALPWSGGTVLQRLLGQLGALGIRRAHVVTRADWEPAIAAAISGVDSAVSVEMSPDAAGDVRAVADAARSGDGGILVAYADMVVHGEALGGLLAEPRVTTGILTTAGRRALAFRVRSARGRVVSASSAYHMVHRATGTFLGALKVAAADRPALTAAAAELERALVPPLPTAWTDELERKADRWRMTLADGDVTRAAGAEPDADDAAPDVDDAEAGDDHRRPLAPPDDAEIKRRLAVIRNDVAALLVVALARSGVPLATRGLRRFFWARPLSRAAVEQAVEDIAGYDEERVLLDSAVKATDGFFTTFFVSPYSKYLARWAARRGWTPNAVTSVSLVIGILAAAAFATGERAGLIAGAVLLQLSFTTDCVDGQLARYTRQFSKFGAWLDSVFDRAKEYAVFAGLAIGAAHAGDPVWLLAGSALTLQTSRHMLDFSYAAAQHDVIASAPRLPLVSPSDRPATRPPAATAGAPSPEPRRNLPARVLHLWRRLDRLPVLPWIKRMVAFPIGERFAAISVTAAVATPRTTFLVLLAWGAVAFAYTTTGRLLRSVSR
jgi:phosphatidylglycerophosphate synthase